jgi:hypothetical protein
MTSSREIWCIETETATGGEGSEKGFAVGAVLGMRETGAGGRVVDGLINI